MKIESKSDGGVPMQTRFARTIHRTIIRMAHNCEHPVTVVYFVTEYLHMEVIHAIPLIAITFIFGTYCLEHFIGE